MQDTDSKQTDLLKCLFDDSVVVQRIGDVNQAIFSFNSMDEDCPWSVTQCTMQLEITGSKRFSNAIAHIIAPICVKPQPLAGNDGVPDIKPVICAFADKNIQRVIPWFASLILEEKLYLEPKCCFKAVGWIGKPHENMHTISSYWPSYQKELHTKSSDHATLASYLEPESDDFIQQNSVNHYRKSIIRALLKCVRVADKSGSNHLLSERALLNYISTQDQNFDRDFRVRLAKWCLSIHKRQQVLHEIIDYVKTDFSDFFAISQSTDLDQFLCGPAMPTPKQLSQTKSNVYFHTSQDTQIEIQVCTIHGAKGETHTATLYLETFYHKYDIVRIIEYLKGTHTPPKQRYVQQNLRMAYVGMSRPTHLLCVAVHEDHLLGHEDELDKAGWRIGKTLA
jgi:DNA helicase II / ATP-dependent DNA helicase PcrA